MKALYLAAYHQSRFGKLGAASVPAMIEAAVAGACDEIGCDAAEIDVASVAAACPSSFRLMVTATVTARVSPAARPPRSGGVVTRI